MELQTIGQAAKECGVSIRMLRYYEQIGLIESQRKGDGAYRVYDGSTVQKLRQIIVLRKLRVSVKQIGEILGNPNAAVIVDIFKQNIDELDDEIATLSTVKSILSQFIEKLQEAAHIQLELDFTSDESVLSAIETLSFTKNHKKENYTMEDLNKADRKLQKSTDVRIVYLPPATIAITEVKSEQSEQDAYAAVAKFAKDTDLLRIKPDARSFGFDFHSDGTDGYRAWATIPDDIEVSDPFKKGKFPGGLFACHARAINDLNLNESSFLNRWVNDSEEFEFDRREQAGIDDTIGMYDTIEEHFVFASYEFENPQSGGYLCIDFLMPVKEITVKRRNELNKKIEAAEKSVSQNKTIEIDVASMKKIGEGIQTKQSYRLPLKMELRAKTTSNYLSLDYAGGSVLIWWDDNHNNTTLYIKNIMDNQGKFTHIYVHGGIPVDKFVDIEWILGKDVMIIKVNGETRQVADDFNCECAYIKNFRVNPEFELSSPIIIPNASSTVTAERLRITEI